MGPRIKTTVVGSYPAPPWLSGRSSLLELRDAVMVALKTQELAGLDLIADGELPRYDLDHPATNGMVNYFVTQLDGVRTEFSMSDFDRFRSDRVVGSRGLPAGMVVAEIGPGTLNLPRDYAAVRSLTTSALKFTCTGPHMLARILTNIHYKNRAELAMDIAGVLAHQLELVEAEVVQIDEANIAGHPEDQAWAAEALNVVLDAIPNEKAVHICFGNYGGQTLQRGHWDDLLGYMNALRVDHLVLEFARRNYAQLDVLKELDPAIGLGIGVSDIKDIEVESPQLIAQRIERIVDTLGEERLRYIHPDCGLWMLRRGVADRKLRAIVEGRNLFEGRP
jgi:5-methyltetrahydropteroyltriglutamate--homocysteine methyltransferase